MMIRSKLFNQRSVSSFFIAATGCVLIFALVCVTIWSSSTLREWILEMRLDAAPNADYVPLIEDLAFQERFSDALHVISFVERRRDMPGIEDMAPLRRRIQAEENSASASLRRGINSLSALLQGGEKFYLLQTPSGKPASKRASRNAHKLAEALESAHLGFSERWFPSVIRMLSRTERLHPEYEQFLRKNAQESAKRGEATAELRSAIAGTSTLVSVMGFSRAIEAYSKVRNDSEIEQLAMWARMMPDEAYIITAVGGVDLLPRLQDTERGRALLDKITRKGAIGVRLARFWLK